MGANVTIPPNPQAHSVGNSSLANVPTQTIKGRTTAGTGSPEDLTATQATAILNNVVGDSGAGGTKGLVPAPAAGDAAAGKFLKADGAWTAVNSGANTALSNLATTSINKTLLPDSDGGQSIGSTSLRWSNGRFSTSLTTYNGTGGAELVQQGAVTTPSGIAAMGLASLTQAGTGGIPLGLFTQAEGTANATATSKVAIETGNKVAGTGNSGDILLKTGTSSGGSKGTIHVDPELRLDGSTSGYVGVKSPAAPTSYTVTLPSAQGAASTVLTNDGSGVLSWASASAGASWAVVASQFDKTDATLADVTGLSVNVSSSKIYKFRATLYVNQNTTGLSKVAMSGTATSTYIIFQVSQVRTPGGATNGLDRITALDTSSSTFGASATIAILIDGTFSVNAGGTFKLQFAQDSANGTSSVLVGSTFSVEQIS